MAMIPRIVPGEGLGRRRTRLMVPFLPLRGANGWHSDVGGERRQSPGPVQRNSTRVRAVHAAPPGPARTGLAGGGDGPAVAAHTARAATRASAAADHAYRSFAGVPARRPATPPGGVTASRPAGVAPIAS